MMIRHALLSAGTAVLGCVLLAPVAFAANGESTPLNLPAQSAKQAAPSSGGGGGLVRTIVGLAVVLGVIYGLYWVLKQVKASREEKSSGQGLEPLATLPLGGNRSLQLVRAGAEIVLLGVGEGGVTPIRTYTEAEAQGLGLVTSPKADGGARGADGLAGESDLFGDVTPPARLGAGGDPFVAKPTFRQALSRGVEDLRKRTVIRK
jgi:flagellar protein FliO/FliZ